MKQMTQASKEQRGPSGLYVGENLPPNYYQRLAEARAKIAGMLGKTVVKETFEWTVVAEHHSTELPQNRILGIKGLELHQLDKKSIFATMFLHLMFQDWKESMNKKQFRQLITAIWEDESTKDSDPWW